MNRYFLYTVGIILLGLMSFGVFVFFFTTSKNTTGESIQTSTSTSSGHPITSTSSPIQPALPVATPVATSTSVGTTTSPYADSLERFVVPLTATTTDQVADTLLTLGFITNKNAFISAYMTKGTTGVAPGAYKLSKQMKVSEIATTLRLKPYMKWVVIPEGLRKEEIAEILGKTLSWTTAQKTKWITTYTALQYDFREGVYFPDTYLIPVDEAPLDVANRLIAKFNEKFAPYLPQFAAQNIKWTTGLTFASIVQREAANDADMPLIAGILWNRLNNNMYLGVDATLQYARGDVGNGWWAPIKSADKQLDSPFNTYTNKGLPPHAISNPGIPAIEATLNPSTTTCLYYLHDKNKVIHCATTYEEHQANIQKYLVENQ